MTDHTDAAVIGGGQAGLAASHQLTEAGVEHVVLERGRIGQTWRGRWDSFCLVTPNWTIGLPDGTYDGSDPDGFMRRDELVAFLERYAHRINAPVREGVTVKSLDRRAGSAAFRLQTTDGELTARTVVIATGAYQRPHRPEGASSLPPQTFVIDAEDYRNPDALPSGKVLVIGGAQTGCQLAEELHEAGRAVFLACGKAGWVPRRFEGRDAFRWLVETPFFEMTLNDLPSPMARLGGNPQATGHGNGHDLSYRTLHTMGVTLLGRFLGATGRELHFADDLVASIAFSDARYGELRQLLFDLCTRLGRPALELPDPPPFTARAPERLDLDGFGAVIFTSGFRPDYRRWVPFPDSFDAMGFPIHRDCESTTVPGLFFLGVHFLRTRKSSLLMGVGEDAAIVGRGVASRLGARAANHTTGTVR